jgi:hypothetical protein
VQDINITCRLVARGSKDYILSILIATKEKNIVGIILAK